MRDEKRENKMIILQIHFYALKARGNERVKLSINASIINGKDHYIAINVSKVQTVNTSIHIRHASGAC